jgi:dolichyl-phosphate beta-glucosyltransferase
MTVSTVHSIELSNGVSNQPQTADETHIPAVLLRKPCHLEVLIPALNEAKRLPYTLLQTLKYLEQQPYSASVVVIDNGSVDQTSDVAAMATWSERVPVCLTGCARLGKGAAVRRGIITSRAHFIGYMDADLATPIETLDVVMELLGDGRTQAVVGSRRIGGASLARRQPVHRAVGGMVFHALTQRVLGDLTDTQCGFKFFAGDLARTVARRLTIDGFAFDVEMLRAIAALGVDIREIPVTWTDAEGSTLNSLRDGTRAAIDLYRLTRRGNA